MSPHAPIMRVLWVGAAVLLVALVPVSLFRLAVGHAPVKAVLLVACLGVLVAGSLLRALRASAFGRGVMAAVAWSLLLGTLAVIVVLSQVPSAATPRLVLRLLVAVSLFGFLLDRAAALVAAAFGAERGASLAVLGAFALLSATPVWLGPWAEALGGGEAISNAMIWSSPVTYFAVMLDYDYLRSHWFYMYTPFGGLRYTYPGQVTFSAAYLLVGGLFCVAESMRRRR